MKYEMSIIKLFTTLLKILGHPVYSNNNEEFKIPLRAKFLLYFTGTASLLGVINLYYYWNDINRRFLIFEDIAISLVSLLFITDVIYSPNNTKKIIDITRYSVFTNTEFNKYIDKNDFDKMIDKANTFSWNLSWLMIFGFAMFYGFVCGVPCYLFINGILRNEKIDYDNQPMPFPSFIPVDYRNNFTKFTIVFIIQIFVLAILLFIIATWTLVTSSVLIFVSYEVELLSNSIQNLDFQVTKNNVEYKIDNYLQNEMIIYERKLKEILSMIHKFHIQLKLRIRDLNKSLHFTMFLYNQLTCFHMSLTLYCMFKNTNFSSRSKYIVAYSTTVNCYGVSCILGQFLINTSEKLWEKISAFSWQNKPSWFKHGIKMLLIGTSKPLEMKPANIYVMDLKFLLKILQASYSYCNLMLQLNTKENK